MNKGDKEKIRKQMQKDLMEMRGISKTKFQNLINRYLGDYADAKQGESK